jgi:hypothetical protein
VFTQRNLQTMSAGGTVVKLEKVCKIYGRDGVECIALHGVSLGIEKGATSQCWSDHQVRERPRCST